MALLDDRFGSPSFAYFGANDDYCDETYPSDEVPELNSKCKKSCSGLSCISNPGLLADPWTVVGKSARGLPDDSTLASMLAIGRSAMGAQTGSKAPGGSTKPPGAGAGGMLGGSNQNTILLLGGGALALFAFMKMKKGGKGFGSFGSPKGRKHRGYKRRGRRLGR